MLFCCFSIVGEKIHVIWFIVRKFTEQFVAYYINVIVCSVTKHYTYKNTFSGF